MSVGRKIFLAMAVLIAMLVIIFVGSTYLVVQASFDAILEKDKGAVMDALSERLALYYESHGRSWAGLETMEPSDFGADIGHDFSIVVAPQGSKQAYAIGPAARGVVTHLGIKRSLRADGNTMAAWYYHDADVDNLSKLRYGIAVSVGGLLAIGAVLLAAASLLAAYGIARRITSPLRRLLPAIDRLSRGEYGVQAPVVSRDEFGKVAAAFNALSLQLHRYEETRRSLVADVAHELRTPITIVRGKLDGLQQAGTAVEPEQLLPLQDELIRLSRLVDDLHQLSLAEARRLQLEKTPTDMAALLGRIVDHVEPDAMHKRIQIVRHFAEGDVRLIAVDPNRMTQVLLNLLGNAVRYTPEEGEVRISLRECAAQAGKPSALRIAIADTGPGIAPERLPHIFNRFYRTDDARARNSGGMGLGLAIAKEFVLAHHGSLEAESRIGEGTVFLLELPYSAVETGLATDIKKGGFCS